jgi:hypothetical protein
VIDLRINTFIFSSSISFHLSMLTDLTKDRCTPRPRCFPEHSRQIQMPYVTEAHCGLWALHSKHLCKAQQNVFFHYMWNINLELCTHIWGITNVCDFTKGSSKCITPWFNCALYTLAKPNINISQFGIIDSHSDHWKSINISEIHITSIFRVKKYIKQEISAKEIPHLKHG